jgi:bacteriorhodopsin
MVINKTNVNIYRYFDWFFTTPILLIDLCIIFDITDVRFILEIIGYNTLMLLFGYLGEIGVLSTMISTIGGFIPFIILFYRIHNKVREQKNTPEQKSNKNKLLNIFIVLWSLYGVNHMYKNTLNKNGIYNILDLLTKGIFALYIYKSSWEL